MLRKTVPKLCSACSMLVCAARRTRPHVRATHPGLQLHTTLPTTTAQLLSAGQPPLLTRQVSTHCCDVALHARPAGQAQSGKRLPHRPPKPHTLTCEGRRRPRSPHCPSAKNCRLVQQHQQSTHPTVSRASQAGACP